MCSPPELSPAAKKVLSSVLAKHKSGCFAREKQTSYPVVMSQTRIVPSKEAEMTYLGKPESGLRPGCLLCR
eukprot:113552-Rhodomonas_salina.1